MNNHDISSPLSSRHSDTCPSTPSSPLSELGRTPSPFPEQCSLPSPFSTLPSDAESPSRSRELTPTDRDGPPPPKKRKLTEPKKRTTEYLELGAFDSCAKSTPSSHEELQFDRLCKALRTKQKIVVIAGAGISVSAGIPDFRSSTGLFTTLRSQHKLKASGKHLFDASVYKTDSSTTSFHDMVRELSLQTRDAKPTPFHHMLATLAQEGRLLRLYTQNVDGIDTAMEPLKTQVPLHPKGPWPKTIQLHGGLEKSVCTKCGNLNPFEPHLFQGPEPPFCKNCVDLDLVRTKHAGKRSHGIGRLRPRMVLYNEFNPDDEAIGAATAADLKARPDCVIVVGTSLKVPGVRRIAREMCAVSRGRRDGFTAWINQGPEPMGVEFKDSWDLVVRGSSDDVANYVNLPKWDEKMEQEFVEVTQEVVEATKRDIQVRLPSPPKLPGLNTVEKTKGIITPTASPRRQSPALFNGIQKLKQAPLAFGKKSSTTTKVEPAESAPSKKRVKLPTKREKKQKEPNVKPINQSMRTTKVSNLPSGKPLKNIDPPASSPNLIAMKSLSPGEFRNNSDPASAQLLEEAWNHAVTSKRALSIPSTPPPPHSSQARGTISPTGVPRGMDSLIDH